MCEHLQILENELKSLGIKETYRGQPWSKNCREWVYFDCYLDIKSLQERYKFPEFIRHHYNDDERSGLEEGFYCELCRDAVIGLNSKYRDDDDQRIFFR